VRAYLPKDSLMIAAFWSQYETLAKWIAWERGGTRAKEAAALYRELFDRSREINDCADGSCGLMDVRQKPDNPCVLQKLDDCSDEWIDFADTRLCSPKMRFNGLGVLEQWNGTEWVPAYPVPGDGTGEPYAEGHDISNQIANYDPPPAGQDGACLAAINAVTYLQAAINAQMAQLKELPFLVRLVDGFVGTWFLRVYGMSAFGWNTLLSTIFGYPGSFFGMSYEQAWSAMEIKSMLLEDDIISYDIREDALCIFYDAYEDNGTMTEASFTGLMSDLQTEVSEREGIPAIKFEWMMLLAFPGPTWMANISNNAGIDAHDCDVCGWEKCWDFTSSNEGWHVQQDTENRWPDVDLGVWSGAGWAGVAVSPPDGYRCLSIRIAPDDMITVTSIDGFVTLGGGSGVRNCAVIARRGGGWTVLYNKTDANNETVHQTWEGSLGEVEELWIEIEGFYSSIVQTSLCVKGSLPEPEWE